jgi:hypothetical protein
VYSPLVAPLLVTLVAPAPLLLEIPPRSNPARPATTLSSPTSAGVTSTPPTLPALRVLLARLALLAPPRLPAPRHPEPTLQRAPLRRPPVRPLLSTDSAVVKAGLAPLPAPAV